jgi:hypothetical protein
MLPVHNYTYMGYALWVDQANQQVWVRGTHEYRPMGTAVVARTDQFRHRDFRQTRRVPDRLRGSFAGFFGSLEEVNVRLRGPAQLRGRATPAHLL